MDPSYTKRVHCQVLCVYEPGERQPPAVAQTQQGRGLLGGEARRDYRETLALGRLEGL